jgi:accessory gene regulator B
MLTKASQQMTEYFLQHGIISEDAREIYAYGFEIILSTVLNFILTAALALLYGRLWDALIYSASTFPLRTFGGGWHASTHFRCSLMHACAFTAASWICFWLWGYAPFVVVIVLMTVVLAIVLARAPSEHPDNPLTPTARIKSRRRCIVYTLILFAAATVAGMLGYAHISLLIAVSAFSAAATLLFVNKADE